MEQPVLKKKHLREEKSNEGLRHFDLYRWSVAFYTYSNEKDSPCIFQTGDWLGTVEEAFDIGAVYLWQ